MIRILNRAGTIIPDDYVKDYKFSWHEAMKKGPPKWLAKRSKKQQFNDIILRFCGRYHKPRLPL